MGQDFSDEAESIRADVERSLSSFTERLTAVLARLVKHPFPPGVASVEFQVFPDPGDLTDGFPVRAFFLDEDNTEHFEYRDGEAEYPCSVDPDLLDVEGVMDPETWEAWDTRCPGVDSYTVAAEAVVPWFHACWKEAGGETFPLPAFICVHDGCYALDLRKGTCVDTKSGEPIDGEWPLSG